MKRAKDLFERVWAFDNLLHASRLAERGKRYRPDVLEFNRDREDRLHVLRRALRDESWKPGDHRHFKIFEPKPRWISAAPYADRVVHHALCNVIAPALDRKLIHDCWANRVGKGGHRAVLRYQQLSRRYAFALKADIQRYFPSIDHVLVKGQLRTVFKDRQLLALIDRILDGGAVPEPFNAWFPGDDLLTPASRRKGLPIGNLTSQLWANHYLSDFDHWVKQELGARGYLRFVDDFILLHDDKRVLASWRKRIEERLFDLRLRLHLTKCVVRQTAEGVSFLGYVVWPERIRVRGETLRRYRRHLKTLRETGAPNVDASLAAWRGHLRLAGDWRQPGRLGGS